MRNPTAKQIEYAIHALATDVVLGAEANGQSSGQFLYNLLPDVSTIAVAGTNWDPRPLMMSMEDIRQWMRQHLIFDSNADIVGIRNGETILWEKA